MRQIRFRAHIKEHGFMGDVYEIDFQHGLVKVMRDDVGTTHTFGITKVDLLQFTGLKDCNGVDIYEGDILQGEWGEQCDELEKDKFVAKVIFINGCFRLDWWMKRLTLEGAATGILWREYMHSSPDRFYETGPLEVVGNIYQHKEPLE